MMATRTGGLPRAGSEAVDRFRKRCAAAAARRWCRRQTWLLLVALAGITLSGCPPKTNEDGQGGGLPPCKEFGQKCEFSPGKLGACVRRDECTGQDCFVCQSQH